MPWFHIIGVNAVMYLENRVPLQSYSGLSKQNNSIAYNSPSSESLDIVSQQLLG